MIEATTFLNIDKEYQFIFKKLCSTVSDENNPDIKRNKKDFPFPTQWELFVWCAILGYKDGNQKKINKKLPLLRWQYIGDEHRSLLLIFAINHFKSFDIIEDKEKLRQNIEEHANRGLEIMNEKLAKEPLAFNDIENLIHQIQLRIKV